MSAIVRPSRADDLEALYEMAKLTGAGFTNLPLDRPALAAKLARSEEAFARPVDAPKDDLYMLVLEDNATGRVSGTAQIFARIGTRLPFYSYRLGTLSQTSKELNRSFRAEMLTLVTDLEGSAEVGGLFLHPRERASGLGMLLARSRYLFVRQHRARFADRMIAELRGVIDEAGGSPFWDGLAGKFFGMGFQQADQFNAINGNQFIADLMPKHPIYTAMLPDSARAVIGLPHPRGRAAMRMLEKEGFTHNGYVDIFDGGPTLSVATDQIQTVRDAREASVSRVDANLLGGARAIVAHGRLGEFRAGYARIIQEDSQVAIDAEAAGMLSLAPGDRLIHVAR